MNRLRALILDFDGVILESNGLKARAFERVFARFPAHAGQMMAYHHEHVSESRFVKFQHLATVHLGLGKDDPIVDQLAGEFSAEMLRLIDTCPMVPGARELLDRSTQTTPVFLASVTPQHELETILARRGLASCFARVYGCPPWTKVSAIADVVRRAGGPEDVVFVGDSSGDQRSAEAACVEFIGRDSGLPFDDPQPRRCADLHEVLAAIGDRLAPAAARG